MLFLAPKLGLFLAVWIVGLFAYLAISIPWLGPVRWVVLWTLVTVVPFMYWTVHSGKKLTQVAEAHLFREFLSANKWILGLVGGLIVKLLIDIFLTGGIHR